MIFSKLKNMYINYPRKSFAMYFNRLLDYGNHYAIFFKDNVQGIYVVAMKEERIYNYRGCPVLKVIDLNTLYKQDPDFVWKVFEQTLKELDVSEDF